MRKENKAKHYEVNSNSKGLQSEKQQNATRLETVWSPENEPCAHYYHKLYPSLEANLTEVHMRDEGFMHLKSEEMLGPWTSLEDNIGQ